MKLNNLGLAQRSIVAIALGVLLIAVVFALTARVPKTPVSSDDWAHFCRFVETAGLRTKSTLAYAERIEGRLRLGETVKPSKEVYLRRVNGVMHFQKELLKRLMASNDAMVGFVASYGAYLDQKEVKLKSASDISDWIKRFKDNKPSGDLKKTMTRLIKVSEQEANRAASCADDLRYLLERKESST